MARRKEIIAKFPRVYPRRYDTSTTKVRVTLVEGPAAIEGRRALLELDPAETRRLAEELLLRAVRLALPRAGLMLEDEQNLRAEFYVRGVFDEACAIAQDGRRA